MSEFDIQSDSVNVEQIMAQIRARISEKRGVDYTEQQIRELAAVKLEKFLDPRGVRSDLLARFKEREPHYVPPILPSYRFEDTTIYETHRGALAWIRRVLNPVLKLFFNPNPIIHAFHTQVEINRLNLEREATQEKRRIEMETLYYELVHNLVFELTRIGIETRNLKMRVESLASRLEFNERRTRALESVVIYKPAEERPGAEEEPSAAWSVESPGARPGGAEGGTQGVPPGGGIQTGQPAQPGATVPSQGMVREGPGQRSRRRRRRRGRRGGAPASVIMGGGAGPQGPQPTTSGSPDSPVSRAADVPRPDAQPAAESTTRAPAAGTEPAPPAGPVNPDQQ